MGFGGTTREFEFVKLGAVQRDPTKDTRAIKRVPFVMKGGLIYKLQ